MRIVTAGSIQYDENGEGLELKLGEYGGRKKFIAGSRFDVEIITRAYQTRNHIGRLTASLGHIRLGVELA